MSQKLPNSLMNLLCLEAWERNKELADGRHTPPPPPPPRRTAACIFTVSQYTCPVVISFWTDRRHRG